MNIRSRLVLVSTFAALGGATLLASFAIGAHRPDGAGPASASAAANATLAPTGADFAICHTPAPAWSGAIRLAQTRTEVPPSEMKAATPAPRRIIGMPNPKKPYQACSYRPYQLKPAFE